VREDDTLTTARNSTPRPPDWPHSPADSAKPGQLLSSRIANRYSDRLLDDLKTVHTRGFSKFLSVRAQEEHDCSRERFRLLAMENFSGTMGSGDVIYQKSGESGWAPIPQGTLAQSVWKYVCGEKR